MKIRKEIFFYIFWAVFFLYGIDNQIFERLFFFNEVLALIGLVVVVHQLFTNHKNVVRLVQSQPIVIGVLGLLVLSVVHLIFSLGRMTNLYYYLRSSVIVYSIFTFFFAYFGYQYLPLFLSKIRYTMAAYLLFALIYPSIYLLERFMGAVFFPLLLKKYRWWSVSAILSLSVMLSVQYESLTVIMVMVIVLLVIVLPSYNWFKLFFFVGAGAIIFGLIYFTPNIEKYNEAPYSVIGNVKAVAESHKILNLDGNSTWRVVFWHRVIVERFPENLLGIGFGTPLLPFIKNLDTIELEHDDEYDMHVSGVHNTYLTLGLRLGILFFLILGFIFHQVLKYYYKQKRLLIEHQQLFYFYSFFTVAAVGLFNLVLESPTVASLFWGFLGIITAIITKTRTYEEISE